MARVTRNRVEIETVGALLSGWTRFASIRRVYMTTLRPPRGRIALQHECIALLMETQLS